MYPQVEGENATLRTRAEFPPFYCFGQTPNVGRQIGRSASDAKISGGHPTIPGTHPLFKLVIGEMIDKLSSLEGKITH